MSAAEQAAGPIELILGNANPRFSGVTSTMLQTLEHLQGAIDLRILGAHHLPDRRLAVSFRELVRIGRSRPKRTPAVIFHARRNKEMIQALALKYLFGVDLKIVFTSTAQRHHSRLSRWLMSEMDAIISTCSAAANYLRLPPDEVIPHGVDTERYRPAANRQQAWQQLGYPGRYGMGIFGRVRKQKGVAIFVEACLANFARHRDYSALIVGKIDDAKLVNGLQARIARAGLSERIIFTGEQPFERLPALFKAMSLVCAFSDNEGYGLTVPEAMASGAAVLATRAGAWPDILEGERAGRLIDAGEQAAANRAMHTLLGNPPALARMGRAGREIALAKYRVCDEAAALCRFYRRLAGGD